MAKNQFKIFGKQLIRLEYPVVMTPRWGHGKPAHKQLNDIISQGDQGYGVLLQSFLRFSEAFAEINLAKSEKDHTKPSWNNGFFPGLDMVALYGMLARLAPSHYLEVGSGNSTKMARKAINEQNLPTHITSIDPFPRADIDALSNTVIRKPLENLTDYRIFEELSENDVLFIDNSHRTFPNSDVTVFFMEILPRLQKGVVVHIHDIYLPYDYPEFMCDRAYNEQYLLAMAIMSNPGRYQTLLPNYYISEHPRLKTILAPLWSEEKLKNVEPHGGSYWLRIG